MKRLHLDFESRSPVDLRAAGLYIYAAHAHTTALCLAWAFGNETPQLWKPGEPFPRAVLDHIAAGGEVVAHNAPFEIAMWNGPLQRQLLHCPHGVHDASDKCNCGDGVDWLRHACSVAFPVLKPEQCDCTMARAYALSWPGGLDDLAPAMRLGVAKDRRGRFLIQKLCKPQRAADGSYYWNNSPELLAEMYAYCLQDVRVEQAVDRLLMPLSPSERALWVLDQKINARGVYVDTSTAARALAVAGEETEKAALEVREITGGIVGGVGQVARIQQWLATKGVKTKRLTKSAVANMIRDLPDMAPEIRRLLTLRQDTAKSSVSKFAAMQRVVGSDGRARGMFQYHGAGTGRWSGRLLQVHNFPRGTDDFTPDMALYLVEMLRRPNAGERIALTLGNPMDALSFGLRPMLMAAPGNELHAADYSNIEGRVAAWLAGEEWKLDAFREYDAGIGPDLYNLAYAKSFNVGVASVTKAQRQIGKVQELALGFQGGVGAFASMAANYGIWVGDDLDKAPADAKQKLSTLQADEIKTGWRDAHPYVVRAWYELDRCARKAIASRSVVYALGGKIAYRMHGDYLLCRLPSGRVIAYPFARIEPAHDFGTRLEIRTVRNRLADLKRDGRKDDDALVLKWRDKPKELEAKPKTDTQITYDGFNSQTRQWGAETTYGGKLFENVVQAIARCALDGAMRALEAAGWPIVLHVHDEIVCETPAGKHSLNDMVCIMSTVPAWAPSLPLSVAGWTGIRYRK